MKIDNETSREIYELATDPTHKSSNREIGEKFGITETAVRKHIKKWEGKLHEIAKTNEKAAKAIANHAVDVRVEANDILHQVKASIQEAKNNGISPEKLAPLYTNWIKSLELCSELLGDIDRAPEINVNLHEEYIELKSLVLQTICRDCRKKLKGRLHENSQ